MMRIRAMVIAAFVVGTFAVGTPAKAVEWPWCADMYDKDGTATSCGFVSWQQCQEYISGMLGLCYPNPFYREERSERRRRR